MPLLLTAQSFVSPQDDKGINWTTGLSWQQVKAKAKKENKYIFVDAYATWCKPCKEMDMKVYTVDSVGEYLNAEFISVKLQMDVTKNDNDEVKSWYKTAKNIESQYRITAYPSYVFFAPNGEVVSKAIGYKDAKAFLQVARDAKDPSKQYFPLLKKYKQGKLDHAGTVSLIKMAQQIGDTADYRQILDSYYSFLRKQKKEKLYTKENIEFIASTLDRSSQVLFNMFYPNGKEVDRVMQSEWYAKKVVDKIIRSEKVDPFFIDLQESTEPDWEVLYRSIAKLYGDDYAGRNVLEAKANWYGGKEDWLKWATFFNDKIEKHGSDTTDRGDEFRLNNMAFLIFENLGTGSQLSNEIITELKRTCAWMEGVARRGETATEEYRLQQWPLYIDTYANLLHKTGRTTEAIEWQEVAVSKARELDIDKGYIKVIEKNLALMKEGKPTW